MATYYVDFVNGLDANNGLGPDASAGTNKPWKTLTKLLGAAGMASGDTAYLSPAGPFRETVSIAMTSPTVETQIIGDHMNQQGFKTSGGVLVAPGPIIHTGYTTDDKTASSATALITANARDFLTWKNIMFVGGNASLLNATSAASSDWKLQDCAFISGHTANGTPISITGSGVPSNWTIDRCHFVSARSGPMLTLILPTVAGADYDANILVSNCVVHAMGTSQFMNITSSGASSFKGGGCRIRNSSFFGKIAVMSMVDANLSITIPSTITNSYMYTGSTTPLVANVSGQITEDYNLIVAVTPRTLVTAGTHSISDGSYAPLFHFGQERIWGMVPRPFGEPMAGSPLLGFGNDGSQSATDIRGPGHIRPGGGASALPAVGAYERANTFAKEIGTVRNGANSISIVGPGTQDFLVPVSATATSISVFVQWDATYAGTKPQLIIDANGELGVSTETKTAVGASGAWEQLTLSSFTPSKSGIVTIRVVSNDTNGAGHMYVDDFAVA